ncbi:MAG: type IV pilus assembly protein PilM [Phycisphaerae bacterium]|nr:type IV pilus assembly protein PilM [Phycisphaerae bacterium]
MLTNLLSKFQTQIELVGLDIGTASVKLIRLLKDADGYTASVAVKQDISTDPKNEDKSHKKITEAVKECLKKANLSGQNIVCGISGPEVVVRGFKFPPLPDAAIEQAVRLEAQQVCPFDSKQMLIDYQLIENTEVTGQQKTAKVFPRSGVMVACTENVVKEKTGILTEAGAKPLLVDSDALASLNCLNQLEWLDGNDTVAVIDVGWEYTNIVIYGQDGLPFVRDLNNAGRQIVQKISGELELSQEQVRKALASRETSTEMRNKMLLALNNAIRPLALAINETLRFYSFQEKTSGVEKIFLCGGFSLLNTFTEFFSDALPADVELLNPFEKIKCRAGDEGNELLKKYGPGLVVATGLAMRTI